jgi:hypothetical protein
MAYWNIIYEMQTATKLIKVLYAFYGTWRFMIVLIDPYNFTDV